MRKFIIFYLLFFIFFLDGIAQFNPKKYYQNINKAELAIIDSNYSRAGKYYVKAFKQGIYFNKDLWNAFKTSVLLMQNQKNILDYAHALIQRGNRPSIPDTITYQKLHWQFKQLYDTTIVLYISEIKDTFKKIVEDDQAMRKSGCAYTDTCQWRANIVDSINWLRILTLYEKYGTLNQLNASSSFSGDMDLIILHNTQWGRFPRKFLLEQVKNGNYDVRNYATLHDKNEESISKKTKKTNYNYGIRIPHIVNETLFIDITREEVKKINKVRKNIYLETFEEYCRKMIYQYYHSDTESSSSFYFYPNSTENYGKENAMYEEKWKKEFRECQLNPECNKKWMLEFYTKPEKK